MVNDSTNLSCVVPKVARGAPNAGYAEFPASALAVIIGAVDFTPCVSAPYFDSPSVCFCMFESGLDFSFGMSFSRHWDAASYKKWKEVQGLSSDNLCSPSSFLLT